jgi:hypothetical protein
MPPSGYSVSQFDSLAGFLTSCCAALRGEAAERAEPIVAALRREIADIAGYVAEASPSAPQTAVLNLTRDFYERLRSKLALSEKSLDITVQEVLAELRSEILSIKI